MAPASDHLTTSTRITVTALAAISALHLAWGRGSTFPFATRHRLNDAVIGRQAAPSAAACNAVAVLLAGAATTIARASRHTGPWARAGATVTAGVLAVRAIAGFAGRTDLLVPGSDSETFRRYDRRLYSPACAYIAVAAARAAATPSKIAALQ